MALYCWIITESHWNKKADFSVIARLIRKLETKFRKENANRHINWTHWLNGNWLECVLCILCQTIVTSACFWRTPMTASSIWRTCYDCASASRRTTSASALMPVSHTCCVTMERRFAGMTCAMIRSPDCNNNNSSSSSSSSSSNNSRRRLAVKNHWNRYICDWVIHNMETSSLFWNTVYKVTHTAPSLGTLRKGQIC